MAVISAVKPSRVRESLNLILDTFKQTPVELHLVLPFKAIDDSKFEFGEFRFGVFEDKIFSQKCKFAGSNFFDLHGRKLVGPTCSFAK